MYLSYSSNLGFCQGSKRKSIRKLTLASPFSSGNYKEVFLNSQATGAAVILRVCGANTQLISLILKSAEGRYDVYFVQKLEKGFLRPNTCRLQSKRFSALFFAAIETQKKPIPNVQSKPFFDTGFFKTQIWCKN